MLRNENELRIRVDFWTVLNEVLSLNAQEYQTGDAANLTDHPQ